MNIIKPIVPLVSVTWSIVEAIKKVNIQEVYKQNTRIQMEAENKKKKS